MKLIFINKREIFMRKTFLSMVLLLLCWSGANAQYHIAKQVVGTGGFVSQTIGNYKASGIWGQPFVGSFPGNPPHKVYLGFWTATNLNDAIDYTFYTNGNIINYPNPVTNSTTFKFDLKESGFVTLNVYNSIGKLVATVVQNQYKEEGSNTIAWDADSQINNELNSGSYMYELLVVPTANSLKGYALRNMMIITK